MHSASVRSVYLVARDVFRLFTQEILLSSTRRTVVRETQVNVECFVSFVRFGKCVCVCFCVCAAASARKNKRIARIKQKPEVHESVARVFGKCSSPRRTIVTVLWCAAAGDVPDELSGADAVPRHEPALPVLLLRAARLLLLPRRLRGAGAVAARHRRRRRR